MFLYYFSKQYTSPVSKESSRGSVKPSESLPKKGCSISPLPSALRFFSGRTGPSARRIPGQIPAVRCPSGDGREGGFAGHSRMEIEKARETLMLIHGVGQKWRNAPCSMASTGWKLFPWMSDEAGHGAMVPGQNPGGFRPLCRHCTAISLSLYTDL